MSWRIKIPKKVGFLFGKSLLGRVNILDRPVRRRTSLVGTFCCILCQKVEEDLDHLLWDCQDYVESLLAGVFFFFEKGNKSLH